MCGLSFDQYILVWSAQNTMEHSIACTLCPQSLTWSDSPEWDQSMCSFLPALRPTQVAECHPGGHVDLPLASLGLCDEWA